jgi:hypothetical protein
MTEAMIVQGVPSDNQDKRIKNINPPSFFSRKGERKDFLFIFFRSAKAFHLAKVCVLLICFLREGWKWKSFFCGRFFGGGGKKRLQRTARPERLQCVGEGHARKIEI